MAGRQGLRPSIHILCIVVLELLNYHKISRLIAASKLANLLISSCPFYFWEPFCTTTNFHDHGHVTLSCLVPRTVREFKEMYFSRSRLVLVSMDPIFQRFSLLEPLTVELIYIYKNACSHKKKLYSVCQLKPLFRVY